MKRIAISIPEELLPLQRFFSTELEEVVFDEAYRFCNDFYIELEEAVFPMKRVAISNPEEPLSLQRFFLRTRRGRFR